MGFLRRNDNSKPDYTSLQIQTSTSILPIPIVWGQNKIAPNLIWYANFQAVPGGNGKGIGGKGSVFGGGAAAADDYTYSADLIMALCEGPIAGGPFGTGIGLIWKDLAIYVPLELGLGSYPGSTPQAVWPYLEAIYPYNALAYQGTAYLWGAGYNLGDSAAIGNHNVEIYGPYAGTGVNGIDADPALVIYDFLTNAQYGAGFDPASIDFDNPVRLGRRRQLADLLQVDGLRLLAGPHQPRARLEHPRALAAALVLRGRLERGPAEIHSLRRHCDLAGLTNELPDTAFRAGDGA